MTNRLLLIHGINLNLLGSRNPEHYGKLTLKMIESIVQEAANSYGFSLRTYQSNCEGAIVDFLQTYTHESAGIIINPGAFTHYSYGLHDALIDTGLPAIEVHLSDLSQREAWRQHSVTAPACKAMISGKKEQGYIEAVKLLARLLQ